MADEHTPQNGELSARRREDQGLVEVGVTLDGAFIPLQVMKLGFYDKLVQQARDRAEQESQSSPE